MNNSWVSAHAHRDRGEGDTRRSVTSVLIARPFWHRMHRRSGWRSRPGGEPRAVDMLRCPTCTSLLLEGDVKRCPTCGSKIRRRSRPTVLIETNALADRPLPLVERELRARIEAETAAGFRQRRRAAKTARRIAALPSTVLE